MERWFAILLVAAGLFVMATVPTPTGLGLALGLLLVALVLFAATHRRSTEGDMFGRRRRAH